MERERIVIRDDAGVHHVTCLQCGRGMVVIDPQYDYRIHEPPDARDVTCPWCGQKGEE